MHSNQMRFFPNKVDICLTHRVKEPACQSADNGMQCNKWKSTKIFHIYMSYDYEGEIVLVFFRESIEESERM